jgi:hypothetical protein
LIARAAAETDADGTEFALELCSPSGSADFGAALVGASLAGDDGWLGSPVDGGAKAGDSGVAPPGVAGAELTVVGAELASTVGLCVVDVTGLRSTGDDGTSEDAGFSVLDGAGFSVLGSTATVVGASAVLGGADFGADRGAGLGASTCGSGAGVGASRTRGAGATTSGAGAGAATGGATGT